MNESTRKLGFSVSLIALLSFIVYACCFTVILFINEPFSWAGIQHLAEYETSSTTWPKYLGMGCMIVYSCTFVVLVLCIKEGLDESKRIFASVASAFSLTFCICICINYYVQLTSTRLQVQAGTLEGLVQFTQSYNISAINGINMLGWTVFYGISCLALGFVFGKGRKNRVMQAACFANFIIMMAGFVGYLLNNFYILLFTMNLGLGAAGTVIIICFMQYFKKRVCNKQFYEL